MPFVLTKTSVPVKNKIIIGYFHPSLEIKKLIIEKLGGELKITVYPKKEGNIYYFEYTFHEVGNYILKVIDEKGRMVDATFIYVRPTITIEVS